MAKTNSLTRRRISPTSEKTEGNWTSTVPVERIPMAIAELFARLIAPQRRQPSTGDGETREELLTMKEVARRLAVPEAYARDLGRRRELPVVRVGAKYVRVRRSVLDAWIRQREDRHLSGVE